MLTLITLMRRKIVVMTMQEGKTEKKKKILLRGKVKLLNKQLEMSKSRA